MHGQCDARSTVTSITHLTLLLLIDLPRNDERLSWPGWLAYSKQFTHEVVSCPAVSQAQGRESVPVKTDVLPPTIWHHRNVNKLT